MEGYGSATSPVAGMRAKLQSIEARLSRGDIPLEGMEDVKSAVDEMRLRLWAVLTAASSGDPEGALMRFRLRRATEICQTVLRDLESDPLGAHQREMRDLRDVATQVVERADKWIRGTP